jgi:hypothetical protein
MIEIYAVDRSEASAERLKSYLERVLLSLPHEQQEVPPVKITCRCEKDLEDGDHPAILLLGEEITAGDLSVIRAIQLRFPEILILAKVPVQADGLPLLKRLAKTNISEVLSESTAKSEALKKLVFALEKHFPSLVPKPASEHKPRSRARAAKCVNTDIFSI